VIRSRLTLAALAVLALLQLGSLGWTVTQRELALSRGVRFLFQVAPVDPYDAFRGRYVALGQEDLVHTVGARSGFRKGQKVFLSVMVDGEGFAHMKDPGIRPPAGKEAWVSARVRSVNGDKLRIRPPFSRFYMEEKVAPRAERAVRRNRAAPRTSTRPRAWIAVRIRGGIGVIEDLFVDGKPISEYLEEGKNP